MRQKVIVVLILIFLLPGFLVFAFGKTNEGSEYQYDNTYTVILENETLDIEKFLIKVVAAYISPESEADCIRAMAIILRTNVLKAMNWEKSALVSTIPVEYLTDKEMELLWGKENFVEYYQRLEAAVNETKGYALVDKEASYIDALFHRVSKGETRDGSTLGEEYTYLKPVPSECDIEAENYRQIVTYSYDEIIERLGASAGVVIEYDHDGLPLTELIEITESADGYAEWLRICGVELRAEIFCEALALNSPAFTFEDYRGEVRFIVAGIGHGYGLSVYGADNLAKEGYDYKQILKYYYSDVIIKYIE